MFLGATAWRWLIANVWRAARRVSKRRVPRRQRIPAARARAHARVRWRRACCGPGMPHRRREPASLAPLPGCERTSGASGSRQAWTQPLQRKERWAGRRSERRLTTRTSEQRAPPTPHHITRKLARRLEGGRSMAMAPRKAQVPRRQRPAAAAASSAPPRLGAGAMATVALAALAALAASLPGAHAARVRTDAPVARPTASPTKAPASPTKSPTVAPTKSPTRASPRPTASPTALSASCVGYCNVYAPSGCSCRVDCAVVGDCCADACEVRAHGAELARSLDPPSLSSVRATAPSAAANSPHSITFPTACSLAHRHAVTAPRTASQTARAVCLVFLPSPPRGCRRPCQRAPRRRRRRAPRRRRRRPRLWALLLMGPTKRRRPRRRLRRRLRRRPRRRLRPQARRPYCLSPACREAKRVTTRTWTRLPSGTRCS